ncbi:HAMP domain-containing sensor histidine kinase [Bacteroides sp.]|uniref:sensor histidine kinase n=1 Tax=Bacteroides sp. TaxID=29523 RepID=UPI00262DB313|nr:HAMP domain-containing sensor histidine kinase [Bacteroides sp.]
MALTINKDSLIRIAKTTSNQNLKANIYRDLADFYNKKPEETHYLKLLYQLGKETKNKELVLNALTDLASSHTVNMNFDSVYYYINEIKKEVDVQAENKCLSYIRMKLFDARRYQGKKEAKDALDYELDFFKSADKNNIYIQIERAYVSGGSLIDFQKFQEANVHLEEAYQMANKLSDRDDMRYRIATKWLYANNLRDLGRMDECAEALESLVELYKNDYEDNYLGKRIYYNIESNYLQCYASLLMLSATLPKKKLQYYIDEIKKIGMNVTDLRDRYSYLLAMNNYYLFIGDYPNSLANINEQIGIIRTIMPKYLPFKFKLQADIYEEMGDYQNALEKHKTYIQLKDSFTLKERQEQLNTLQVEYEVDKLKYEKANLESRNKRMQIITLSIILLLAILACIYFYYHWKKEKQMKMNLFILHQKAGESERMKAEFINSMCHEIRTPLNSIVGFSDIILDEDYDDESKAEFRELIKTNAGMLTTLIDDLLVVANLDSSRELLPCEVVNVSNICREEFRKTEQRNQKPINYVLNVPEEEVLYSTNAKHLSIVLENLLSNAYKFTQKGCITLELLKSENPDSIRIQISDTGCGIPLDKQEVVFERFIKLDSFTQGNGIGLFLSKLIISRLMGSIEIDSSYTDGARFVISLPAMK